MISRNRRTFWRPRHQITFEGEEVRGPKVSATKVHVVETESCDVMSLKRSSNCSHGAGPWTLKLGIGLGGMPSPSEHTGTIGNLKGAGARLSRCLLWKVLMSFECLCNRRRLGDVPKG